MMLLLQSTVPVFCSAIQAITLRFISGLLTKPNTQTVTLIVTQNHHRPYRVLQTPFIIHAQNTS